MKKTIKNPVILALLIAGALSANAQGVVVPFHNNLQCGIRVGYEEWSTSAGGGCQAGVPGCSNWGAGSFAIPSNSIHHHTTCLNPIVDLCVWVISIGNVDLIQAGCQNHCSMQNCHTTCTGQTGTCGPADCIGGGWTITYAITPTGGSWSIN